MGTVTGGDFQRDWLAVLAQVEAEESVELTWADRLVIEMRPVPAPRGKRPYDLATGEFTVPDDTHDPMWDHL